MKQLLALFHGMTPQKQPLNHQQEYRNLLDALKRRDSIREVFTDDNTVGVEYAHRDSESGRRLDHLLQPAQAFIHDRIGHEGLSLNEEAQQFPLTPLEAVAEGPSAVTRLLFSDAVKEQLLLLGMSDAVFYCSPDGEDAVRSTVYTQILSKLAEVEDEALVKLHIVAHSLGVTVAYDFLFGLFAPQDAFKNGKGPSFLDNITVPKETTELYGRWRQRAQNKTLVLGSFSSTAGQLPVTLQRSARVLQTFAIRQRLDPTVVGLRLDGELPVWRSFFDRDDILGFPTRALFLDTPGFEEYQVNAGNATESHQKMWSNRRVLDLMSELIEINL